MAVMYIFFSIWKCRLPVKIALLQFRAGLIINWSILVIKVQIMAQELTYSSQGVIKMSASAKNWQFYFA